MLVYVVESDYSHAVSNTITDIEDCYKYLESFRMTREASVILDENFTLEMLNEAVSDYWEKFKAKIKAFINAVKDLWNKFWSKIENNVMNDVEWLNNYSKKLLSMDIPDLDYTMYGYFTSKAITARKKLLGDNLLPSYNPIDTKLFEALKSQDAFRTEYLKQFIVKDMSFNEGVKYLCRGSMEDQETYKNNVIKANMETIVNYCLDYPKLARTLQKEKDNLERDLNRISRDIDKIKVKEKTDNKTPETENKNDKEESKAIENKANNNNNNQQQQGKPSTDNNNQKIKESFNPFLLVEGCRFESIPLMERIELFNEDGGVKITGNTNKTKGPVTRDKQGKIGQVDKEVEGNDTKEDIAKRYSTYMMEVYNVIGLRMTIAEEVYTSYMQLLKYLGSDFTKKDRKSAAKSTDKEKENGKDNVAEENKEGKKNDDTVTSVKDNIVNSFKSFFK